jgi:hypothetical protein
MKTLSLVDAAAPTASSHQATYTYEPLDLTQNQIRLLQIKSKTAHQDPIISIESFSLTEDLKYVALSYTWGTDKPSHPIRVEHEDQHHGDVLVSQNLLDFILMAQDDFEEWRDDWYWIDQISINQELTSERNHQVSRMADMFSKAKYVYVWLGPAFDGSDRVVQHILKFDLTFSSNSSVSSNMSSTSSPSSSPSASRASSQRSSSLSGGAIVEQTDQECEAFRASLIAPLGRFLKLRYWMRLWICQEIILAHSVLVYVGNACLAWDEVDWTAWERDVEDISLRNSLLANVTPRRALSRIIALENARQEHKPSTMEFGAIVTHTAPSEDSDFLPDFNDSRPESWRHVLRLSMDAECSILHDRIYGLMGIVGGASRIPVDYDLPIEVVLRSVLKRVIVNLNDEGAGSGTVKLCIYAADEVLNTWRGFNLLSTSSEKDLIQFARRELLRSRYPGKTHATQRWYWYQRLWSADMLASGKRKCRHFYETRIENPPLR